MLTFAETALRRAVTSTFEQVAFLLLEPVDGDDRVDFQSRERQVRFTGPVSGRLVLRVAADALPMLAMSMLGSDAEPTPAEQVDALGELANMICGNAVPALGAGDGLFSLRVEPATGPVVGAVVSEDLVCSVSYRWDDGAMECSIYTEAAP